MHLFKSRMLTLFRNKILIFWSLIFPIILATFYNFAFANMNNTDILKTINVAVVENDDLDENLITVMEDVKIDDLDLFLPQVVNKEVSEKLLNDGDVIGIIEYLGTNLTLTVNENGLRQTITKSFLDEYLQTSAVIYDLVVIGGGDFNEVYDDLTSNINYLDEVSESRNKLNMVLTYFFALLGMALIYGGFWGTDNIINLQANMSGKGIRIAVSPVNRFKTLLIYTLCAFLVHILIISIILFYLLVIIGLDFGAKLSYILVVCLLGSLVGISFGSFVTIALKKVREGVKVLITTVVGVLGGFLAGMMVPDMKYIVQTKLPILKYINPVGVISDALHSLNYYGASSRFYINIIVLIVMFITFTIGTYMFYRRDSYESI
ncbi:MAG TPA: ABC transporter permease [Acholeplasmataceae bacterium]|nr:ABC transporter permease [Acholeplasmataceae bacterium]